MLKPSWSSLKSENHKLIALVSNESEMETLRGCLVPSLESHFRECDSKECDSRELKSRKSDFVMFGILRKC